MGAAPPFLVPAGPLPGGMQPWNGSECSAPRVPGEEKAAGEWDWGVWVPRGALPQREPSLDHREGWV